MRKASVVLLFLIYLGVWGGRLALRSDASAAPLKVFPYAVDLYPEADQQALRRGIPITSLREGYRLMEDYFS